MHTENTKGTNLPSGLLKNKISCFCDVVKMPQPASLWNDSRGILAFLLCFVVPAAEWDPFPRCRGSTRTQRPRKGACSLERRWTLRSCLWRRVGDCALLWTHFRAPLAMGSWSASSQY